MKTTPFEQDFVIRKYEVNSDNVVKLSSFWDILQEAADGHAESLGMSFKSMHQMGVCWVLCRMELNVKRYPMGGDRIKVKTQPLGIKGVFALRGYTVYDEQGIELAQAISCWVVANLGTLKPERPTKFVPDLCFTYEGVFPGKLSFSDNIVDTYSLTAEYTDIDVNNHVNNGKYVAWIENKLARCGVSPHPMRIHINFISETKQGDNVDIHRFAGEDGNICLQIQKEDKTVLLAQCY